MGLRDTLAENRNNPRGFVNYRPYQRLRRLRGFKYWAAHLGPNEPSIRAHKKRLAKLEAAKAEGERHG